MPPFAEYEQTRPVGPMRAWQLVAPQREKVRAPKRIKVSEASGKQR
jgi:hypothetical protein